MKYSHFRLTPAGNQLLATASARSPQPTLKRIKQGQRLDVPVHLRGTIYWFLDNKLIEWRNR